MTILQLRRYQKRDADLDAVAASGVASPWTAYTPTITAGSGTFTTLGAVSGKYMTIGKVSFVLVSIAITTNGTAATYVRATLPNTAVGTAVIAGREMSVTGKMLFALPSGASMTIAYYDNTYPGVSGGLLIVSGCYENA
jgi:hypothetical protein